MSERSGRRPVTPGTKDVASAPAAGASEGGASREQLALIAELAPFPVGVTRRRDGVLLYVNDAFADLLGKPPTELLGQPAPDFYASPEDRDAMLRALEAQGELSGYEIRARRPDGEERLTLVNLKGIRFEGEPAVMATVVDITERSRVEQALREERLRLAGMVDLAGDAIVSVNESGEIVLFNRGAEEIFGYPAGEVMGKSMDMLLSQEHRGAHQQHMSRFGEGGVTSRRMALRPEITGMRRNGEVFPVGVSISKLRLDDGFVFTAILRDLSAQKAVAAALEHSRAQLRQAQKMEAIGRLAGGVAHDFNNLLTAIIGGSELIQRDSGASESVRRDAQEIRRAADRAAKLTNQLLAFGRKQTLRPKVVDLRSVVQELEEMLRRILSAQVDLVAFAADGALPVKIDVGQIEQVLVNLVINGADAMEQGGRLSITSEREEVEERRITRHGVIAPGRWATVTVEDTGAGIDDAILERIFEPFFTTKPMGVGTGLGLSMVLGIVEQSGGVIEVRSAPGRGTAFRVWLPLHDGAIEEESTGTRVEVPDGTERVLLVEDDPTVRRFVVRVLAEHGYDVLEARSAEEALLLDRQVEVPVDLLLADVVMPGLNGAELAAQLGANRPDMRVLFMSGYSDQSLQARGAAGRGILLIAKPFGPDELASAVREVLDAKDAGE